MGVRSTYQIKRSVALSIIEARLQSMPNNILSSILYDLPESEYRNYEVLDDGQDFDGNKNFHIKDIEDFKDF